jgi:RNA polymerase sigma factor (sigma-70 family)
MSLLEMASAGHALSHAALENIIALYWKPIYKYIRVKWNKNNEQAKDLTQGFLATALERDFFARFDPRQASFRTYVRMAVDRYAANEHAASRREKRGGSIRFFSLDLNAEDLSIASDPGSSPEAVFDMEWRRQLFALAIDDLRGRCEREGKLLQFSIFEQYDLADEGRATYADLAQRYAIPVTSVTNYLAWARRMLRDSITGRLRGVTSGDRELHAEMRAALARTE